MEPGLAAGSHDHGERLPPTSQPFQHRGILQGAGVPCDGLPTGQGAQDTAHDFAAAGFGEHIGEADVVGFGDGARFSKQLFMHSFVIQLNV